MTPGQHAAVASLFEVGGLDSVAPPVLPDVAEAAIAAGGGGDSTPSAVSAEALRISARRAQLEQSKIVREEEEVEEAEKLASIKESFE